MNTKKFAFIAALAFAVTSFTGCGAYAPGNGAPSYSGASAAPPYSPMTDGANEYNTEHNTEEYSAIKEAGFKNPRIEPLSTFSADVDTASYTNIRRYINSGDTIPDGAVRIEEMLNYFSYNYPEPEEGKAFSTSVEMGDCPWNRNTKLLKIGLQILRISTIFPSY